MAAKSTEHVEHLSTLLCRRVEQGENGALSAIDLVDMVAVEDLPSESPNGEWEDSPPSAGLWIAPRMSGGSAA
jgi:hypothetical protein